MMNRFLLMGLVLLTAGGVVGCEGEPDNGEPVPKMSKSSIEGDIAKIEADPNMSQQAKQAAIAALNNSLKMQQDGGGGKAAGGPVPQ
jgi:hypothetical protein